MKKNTYNLYGLGLSKPLSPFFLFILAGSKPVGGMKRSRRAWVLGFTDGCGALPGSGTTHSPVPPRSPSHAPRPELPRRPGPPPPVPPPPQTRSPGPAPFSRLRRAPVTESRLSATVQTDRQPTSWLSPLTSDVTGSQARGRSRKFLVGGGALWYCQDFVCLSMYL